MNQVLAIGLGIIAFGVAVIAGISMSKKRKE